jgi:sugar/nucleoside kinase (ribokinase family)
MKEKIYDIITFGDLCVDLIMTGDDVTPQFGQVEKLVGDYTLEMGGSCSIFACQAARLGLRVGILGRVGDDDFGRLIVNRLQSWGVDTQHVIVDPGIKTGMGIALCQGNDRAILTYLGGLNAIYPDEVQDDFLSSSRHLHHGSFFLHTILRPAIPDIFSRAKNQGLTTSLDTNWDPEEKWNATLFDTLPNTDIFFPNEQEALRIARVNTLPEAIEMFCDMKIPTLAVKLGADGALVHTNQVIHRCSLPPADEGGDSIGAGDSFDAGFLAGWLRGLAPDKCLEIGSHCGRSVAGRIGGIQGQPTWDEIASLVELETTQ